MIKYDILDYAAWIGGAAVRPFAQANYGDGEWECILGRKGKNAQGGEYTPKLRCALRETLVTPHGPNYLYGTNPGHKLRDEVDQWIAEYGITIDWVWKEALSAANCHGWLGPLIAALRRRRLLVVGPPHLERLIHNDRPMLPSASFVVVPEVNAFRAIDDMEAVVAGIAKTMNAEVISVSAGMAAKVLIWRLWPQLRDRVILDCGAIWDPYCGVYSRKRYREPDMPLRLAESLAEADRIEEKRS